ncbi:MAG: putative rhomboid protease [Geoglossum simile]|nr:MAG: putative rhomboid protease [Geoglossum simile]
MSSSFPQFSPVRLRSYIFRLPLVTRVVLLVITGFWIVGIQTVWDVALWGALAPKEMGFGSMYRLNTYPLIHVNFLHAFFNCLALAPLLERFEAEFGSLMTLAMFAGPLSTLPAGLYLLCEGLVFRGNTPVMGASVWVFTLVAIEAIKTYRSNPFFSLGTYKIPTWTTPIIMAVFTAFLIPNTSLLGHLCAVVIGYLFALGYLKVLAPPEKILRWVEGKMDLLGRLPHYVSIDQKTYGRYGVLPSSAASPMATENGIDMPFVGPGQRLGS